MSTATKEKPNGVTTKEPARPGELIEAGLAVACRKVDERTSLYCREIANAAGHMERAVLMASAIGELEASINDQMMGSFMKLYNSPLGFRCDKGPGCKDASPYDAGTVKRCVIQGLLQGVYPTGNEMNIIAASCYITQGGYRSKLSKLSGLTDLEVMPGIPVVRDGRTIVRVAASWIYNGVRSQLMGADQKPGRAYAIITNQYSSADQIVGKAMRKALKSIYEKITNTPQTEDADVSEIMDDGAQPAALPAPKKEGPSRTQLLALRELSMALALSDDESSAWLKKFGAEKPEDLSAVDAQALIGELKSQVETERAEGAGEAP